MLPWARDPPRKPPAASVPDQSASMEAVMEPALVRPAEYSPWFGNWFGNGLGGGRAKPLAEDGSLLYLVAGLGLFLGLAGYGYCLATRFY